MKQIRGRVLVVCAAAAGALAWFGCGSTTELVTASDAGTEASTGGSGGSGGTGESGTGGTSVGGSGGTDVGGSGGTGIGGSGGTGVGGGSAGVAGAGATAGSDGGLPDGSPGGMAGTGGSEDAGPACLIIGDSCDPADDTCCDPLFCDDSTGTPRCRPPMEDGGLVCAPPNQSCATIDCCPGLVCQTAGPGEICRFEEPDGGVIDAGTPDANACMDLYTPCGGGLGSNCCPGLECKKQPPTFNQRACLPIVEPDPSLCPSQEPTPGDACSVVGLQCSYSMMTVCTCFDSGWMCAY